MSLSATITQVWNGIGTPITKGSTVDADFIAVDAVMTGADVFPQVSWSSGDLLALFISTPIEIDLSFNYGGTPQNFVILAGMAMVWISGSGIPVPVTGNVTTLKITPLNPTDSIGEVVNIRIAKDATP